MNHALRDSLLLYRLEQSGLNALWFDMCTLDGLKGKTILQKEKVYPLESE